MVFDFTSSVSGLNFLQSVNHFNKLNQIPPADNVQVWNGYEWLYKRCDNILVLDGDIENTSERLIHFKKLIKDFIKKIRIKLYKSNQST